MPNSFSTFLIDTPNIKDGAVTKEKVKDDAIWMSKLCILVGSASGSLPAGEEVGIEGHSCSFFPLLYEAMNNKVYVKVQGSIEMGSAMDFSIRNDDTVGSEYRVAWNYVRET